jgi:hypothetical protein
VVVHALHRGEHSERTTAKPALDLATEISLARNTIMQSHHFRPPNQWGLRHEPTIHWARKCATAARQLATS